jgi:hypothetical protein
MPTKLDRGGCKHAGNHQPRRSERLMATRDETVEAITRTVMELKRVVDAITAGRLDEAREHMLAAHWAYHDAFKYLTSIPQD